MMWIHLTAGMRPAVTPAGEGSVSVRISSSGKTQARSRPLGAIGGGLHRGVQALQVQHLVQLQLRGIRGQESGASRTSARTGAIPPALREGPPATSGDPKFDSSILEEACRERCFPQTRRRFRYVLFYLAAASVLLGTVSLLLILATFSLTLAPQIRTSGFRDFEPSSPAESDEGDFSGMGG
ncbi:unnamed protein product [Boreogadus saida]